MLYCGELRPSSEARWARAISMEAPRVEKSNSIWRKRWSVAPPWSSSSARVVDRGRWKETAAALGLRGDLRLGFGAILRERATAGKLLWRSLISRGLAGVLGGFAGIGIAPPRKGDPQFS